MDRPTPIFAGWDRPTPFEVYKIKEREGWGAGDTGWDRPPRVTL